MHRFKFKVFLKQSIYFTLYKTFCNSVKVEQLSEPYLIPRCTLTYNNYHSQIFWKEIVSFLTNSTANMTNKTYLAYSCTFSKY